MAKKKIDTMKHEKITVLHIMPSLLAPAGTPRKLLSLVQHCDREKFCHVFLLFCNHQDNLSDEVRRAGAIVEEVLRPRNYDLRLLFDIIKMVRKYKVDIINTHFARSDIYGMVAGLLLGIPVIKSVHGIAWNDFKLFIYIDRLLSRYRYITTCNSNASLKAERNRSHTNKFKIIYNGVVPRKCNITSEEVRAYRKKLGIPPDSFLVGHIGGLIELRRQDLIIEAMAAIVKKGIDAYFVIAGDGPEKNNLKEHTKSLNISDRVKFLNYIDDVGDFLASIDVFVNMAHSEGFGIAVVEAMFAGVPVVLANAGAHPELIVDNESGMLVAEGNSEELVAALLRLAADPALRCRLAQDGRTSADEKFTIYRFARDFETVYRECMKKTRIK